MSSDQNAEAKPSNHLVIVTAPSGAGKTTIVRKLIQTFDNLAFSVSATTRSQRQNEVDGEDYYFISQERFKQLIEEKAFAEWEEVYKNQFYGTLRSEIDRLAAMGKCPIFDIDVHGAVRLKRKYPQALSIFIKPPSIRELMDRLQNRKTDSRESITERINKAELELGFESKFDTFILNDDLDLAIIEAESLVKNYLAKSP